MHAPQVSRAPLLLIVLACVGLCQCSHSASTSTPDPAASRVEWYIASREPLTYCPKGHVLPASTSKGSSTFVYLADRRTRFYIPPKAMTAYRQALQVREQSLSASQRFFASSESTIQWVGRRIMQVSATAVLGFMCGVAQANADGGLNEVFDDMWSY